MKVTDILKTVVAILLALVLISCGGGGDTAATAPGISGRITIGGTYFAGVTVTLSGTASATTTTNSTGYYSFTGLANGDYMVTPTRTGCTFTPTASSTLPFSGTSITQNFTAEITPSVAAGNYHSVALKSDGTVWAWGLNTYGQLGNGTTTESHTPVRVSGLSGVIAIAAGGNHTLALKGNGTVWAWGLNANGQLGNGTTVSSLTAGQVSNLTGVAAIAGGGNHSLALTAGGGVKAWGLNSNGQLGDGTVTTSLTPVNVSGLTSGVEAIAAGGYHSLALTTGGGIKAWGLNADGQLGNATTTSSTTCVDVIGLISGVSAISAGGHHSLALTAGGGIKAWGLNTSGQLGNATTTNSSTSVDVSGLTSGIIAIAGGGYHCLALTGSGGVKAWGLNTDGQLGNDSTTNSSTPVNVNSF